MSDNLIFMYRVKYTFPINKTETKLFLPKLNWKSKSKLTSTTTLNISSISPYPNEFYAEYNGN